MQIVRLKLNKRFVLSHLMRLNDPLELLTPKFQESVELLSSSIPSHYLAQKQARPQAHLHIFGDTSELAYACVGYWRFECLDGSVKLSLIGGREVRTGSHHLNR